MFDYKDPNWLAKFKRVVLTVLDTYRTNEKNLAINALATLEIPDEMPHMERAQKILLAVEHVLPGFTKRVENYAARKSR